MFLACQNGDLARIGRALQKRLVASSGGFGGTSFLRAALENQQLDAARVLLLAGADVNWVCQASGCTCLWLSAEEGDVEVLRFLLRQTGVLVDQACFEGRTPLLAALDGPEFTAGHREAVFLLLEGGADPNISETTDLKSPLLCAVELLDLRVVQALLQSGADPSQPDFNGETPLHRLCDLQRPQHDLFPIFEALAQAGADVNARNVGNCTPAHKAGFRGHRAMLGFLQIAGASMGAFDNQFMQPRAYLELFDQTSPETPVH